MDLKNPNWVTRLILKIDPGYLYYLLRAAKKLVALADYVLDLIFGYTITGGWRSERLRAQTSYEHSAQVVKVVARAAPTIMMDHTLDHFLYRHSAYISPRTILENDNWTLYGVTRTHAFFCVSDESFNVYEMGVAPFLFVVQFLESKSLVIVEHKTLHKLAEEVGDPVGRNITLLNMTARCGSTLVGQMLSLVPNVRVMSEPWSFMNLHGLYVRKEISLPQFERLLRSVARLQLKPEVKHPNITHVLVKMSNFAAPQFPTLKKMFPEFTQMFITRQLRPSLRSYVKLYIFLPRLWRSGGKLTEFFFHFLAFPYDDANWWDRYDWLWAVDRQYLSYGTEANMCLIWATGILDYLRHRRNYAKAIIFEDLTANPEQEAAQILDAMGLDAKYAKDCLAALGQDSQMGILAPRGKANIDIPESTWKKTDQMFKDFDLPFHTNMTLSDLRRLIYEEKQLD